jgi:hypothetical protein
MVLDVDAHGALRGVRGAQPPFSTVRDWDHWQSTAIRAYAAACSARRTDKPLFSDAGAILLRGHRLNPLRPFRTGTLILFPDRIELATLLGERIVFPLEKVEGISVLKRALLDFYIGRELYQVRFPFRSISARKWMDAVLALQTSTV